MTSNRKLTDFFRPYVQDQGKRSAPDFQITISGSKKIHSSQVSWAEQRELSSSSPPSRAPVQPPWHPLRRAPSGSSTEDEAETQDIVASLDGTTDKDDAGKPREEKGTISNGQAIGASKVQPSANPSFRSELTSFTSISSLTPPPSSGRKVKSSGEVVVPNSDSEEGDSDSSLEDLDDIIFRKKAATMLDSFQKPKAPESSKPKSPPPMPRTRGTTSKQNFRKPAPTKSYKFDLKKLVSQVDKDAAASERIEKARGDLEHSKEEAKQQEAARKAEEDNGASVVDEAYLASMIDGSDAEDNQQRVMQAMRRTDAFHREPTWSFFKQEPVSETRRKPFPTKSLPQSGWMTTLEDPQARRQACVSGFALDMIRMQALPEELLLWMLDEAIVEPRDDLAHAYSHILKQSPMTLRNSLTPSRLEDIFLNIGASEDAVASEKNVTVVYGTSKERSDNPLLRLRKVLQLLLCLTSNDCLSDETCGSAIKLLLRLGIDDIIRADGQCQCLIEDVLANLLRPSKTSILADPSLDAACSIWDTVQNPQFRLRVLQCIPSTDSQLETYKRRVALAFFFDNKEYLQSDPRDPLLPTWTIRHLQKSPNFDINPGTSYPTLHALTSILDIAISGGFTHLPIKAPPIQADFNQGIDEIANEVTRVHNRIVDTGASHMKRTEAKNALERLKYRLEFAVRTKRRPKKNVFGDVVGDGGAMEKFVGKGDVGMDLG
ncbi:MAG: hypothetical protein M1820_002068 [Bogoriella megaspora]|nr:MAG: hypothetical protein M1820_002068 [Bogoriella megaspora]